MEAIDKLIEKTSLDSMDKKMLAKGKKYKIILPSGKGQALYTSTLNHAVIMAKEYGKGTKVIDLSGEIKKVKL